MFVSESTRTRNKPQSKEESINGDMTGEKVGVFLLVWIVYRVAWRTILVVPSAVLTTNWITLGNGK